MTTKTRTLLCPECRDPNGRFEIHGTAVVLYTVVDRRGVVLESETQKAGWEDDDYAECNQCGWSGTYEQIIEQEKP